MDIFNRLRAYLNSLPPVTRTLLILNVIVFVLYFILFKAGIVNLNSWLGLHNLNLQAYSSPLSNTGDANTFKPIEIITHMFLHGNAMHIFFNMFGLVMFGRILENMLGSQKFFILYFGAGLGAAALQLGLGYLFNSIMAEKIMAFYQAPDPDQFFKLLRELRYDKMLTNQGQREVLKIVSGWMEDPEGNQWVTSASSYLDALFKSEIGIPMVGASGAIMGVVGAFAMYFPNVRLMLIFPPIAMKAKYMITIFIVASLFLGVSHLALTSVAHFAHLGGVIVGLILSLIWKRNQFNNFMIH